MSERDIKLLIVDDEEDILIESKEILEKKGFSVFTAIDSGQALEVIKKEMPKIYILDIHMPKSELDGLRVLEEIRKTDKAAYCIMLSRVDEKEKIDTAKRLGANRYILKPIDYPELLELIDEAAKAVKR
ncbi:MAG: response regulator [Candidatus Omnitrophica bacterium]|nr:response regulator [Candidatus Omnitrophota bacterium]